MTSFIIPPSIWYQFIKDSISTPDELIELKRTISLILTTCQALLVIYDYYQCFHPNYFKFLSQNIAQLEIYQIELENHSFEEKPPLDESHLY